MDFDILFPIEIWQSILDRSEHEEQVYLSQLCILFKNLLKIRLQFHDLSRYFFLQKNYARLLGDKTIVFKEVGVFYQAYQTKNQGYNLANVCPITGCVATKRKPNDDTKIMGFPEILLTQKINRLGVQGYWIITVDIIDKKENITVYKPK